MKPSHPSRSRLPRSPRFLCHLVFLLVLPGLAPLLFAQGNVPIEFLRPMKNSVSIGMRLIGGASVTFGGPGIGRIDAINMSDINPNTGSTYRDYFIQNNNGVVPYDDGSVNYKDSSDATTDGKRPSQSNIGAGADGRWQTWTTVTSTMTNASATVINGDYLAYDNTGDTTRNWSANSADQSPDGSHVEMSTYASRGVQAGQTATAKSNARPGIEIQMGRVIQRFKKFEWGVNFTFGLSEFNAKNRQTLKADAIKYTNRYQVLSYAENTDDPGGNFVINPGVLATGTDGKIMTGPSFTELKYPNPDYDPSQPTDEAAGTNLPQSSFPDAYENNVVLGVGGDYAPEARYGNQIDVDANGNPIYADYQTADGGQIRGYWQVKGVYYIFRLGPMIRVPILKNFAASASIGYMGAWVGSKMRFQETLLVNGVAKSFGYPAYDAYGNIVSVTDITQTNRKFLSGAYVDVNFEWWVTTRTGFYAGAVYEKLGAYTQQVHGRVATVRIDDKVGFHFGIITRF